MAWARAFVLLLALGCDRAEPSLSAVPLARDDAGRAQIWSGCPAEIILEIAGVEARESDVRAAILAATDAWLGTGIPALRVRFTPPRAASEDGHSTISFVVPEPCSSREKERGAGCAPVGWEGITALYGRPDGTYLQTIEGDIRLDRRLASDPRRLTAVLIHEIGHFYGLDHLPGEGARTDTAMTQVPPDRAIVGEADRKALQDAYAKACAARN